MKTLAADVFRVVEDWVKGRPAAEYTAPYLKSIRSGSGTLFKLVRHSLPISAVFAVLAIYCHSTRLFSQNEPATIGFIRESMLYGVLLWTVYLLSGYVASWLTSHLHSLVHRIGSLHPFCLTSGDNNKQTRLAARNKRHFARLCIEGSLAILWNIVAVGIIYFFTK